MTISRASSFLNLIAAWDAASSQLPNGDFLFSEAHWFSTAL
jgi:hypothetical protein